MRNAVRDAGITPDVVGYVNAHGTSTPIGDTLEAHAIRNFFGERRIAVSSTKSMTGHLLGGAGGLEAGVTVLALRDQILPPTSTWRIPIPIPQAWIWSPTRPARQRSNTPCRTLSASAGPMARCCSGAGANKFSCGECCFP